MPLDLLSPAPETPDRAWARLRALRIGHDEGWFRFLAGTPREGRYAVELHDDSVRLLHRDVMLTRGDREVRRDEALAWVHGNAWGHGHPELLAAIEPCPEVLDSAAAASRLQLSTVAINVRVMSAKLNPLRIARRERRFLAAEIDAHAPGASDADRARWEAMRALLPPSVRLDQVPVTETPGPDPLPVPPAPNEPQRCITALSLGQQFGWWTYLHGGTDHYTIVVDGTEVVLPGLAVLPWAWGFADAHLRGDEIAYR